MGLRQQGSGKLPRRFRRAAKGKNHSSGVEAWGSRWRGVGRGAITETSSDDPWPPRHTVRAARCLSSIMAGIGLSSGRQHARRRRLSGKLPRDRLRLPANDRGCRGRAPPPGRREPPPRSSEAPPPGGCSVRVRSWGATAGPALALSSPSTSPRRPARVARVSGGARGRRAR